VAEPPNGSTLVTIHLSSIICLLTFDFWACFFSSSYAKDCITEELLWNDGLFILGRF
jgi:hypothetical protein